MAITASLPRPAWTTTCSSSVATAGPQCGDQHRLAHAYFAACRTGRRRLKIRNGRSTSTRAALFPNTPSSALCAATPCCATAETHCPTEHNLFAWPPDARELHVFKPPLLALCRDFPLDVCCLAIAARLSLGHEELILCSLQPAAMEPRWLSERPVCSASSCPDCHPGS